MMKMYDSPLLSLSDIVTYFRTTLNVNISEADLKQPNPKKWREIYSLLFEVLTSGRSIEEVVQRVQSEMRMDTANPRFFEEAFGQMAFTNCMGLVLGGCGYSDFSLKNVLQPTADSVRRICSVFINRGRWDQGVTDHFNEALQRNETAKGQSQSLLNRNAELKKTLEEKQMASHDAEMEKCKEEYERINFRKEELTTEMEDGKRKKTESRLKLAEIQKNKESLSQAISNKRQECDKLSSKIVQSPRKFQKEQEQLLKEVNELKTEWDSKMQTLSENRLLLEETVSKEHASERALKMVNEILADLEQDTKIYQEMQLSRERKRDIEDQINSINAKEEDFAEMLALRREQRHQKSSQADIKNQSKWQQLNDLKAYGEKLKETLKAMKHELSDFSNQVSIYKDKQEEIQQSLNVRRSELQEVIRVLVDEGQLLDQKFADEFSRLEPFKRHRS